MSKDLAVSLVKRKIENVRTKKR